MTGCCGKGFSMQTVTIQERTTHFSKHILSFTRSLEVDFTTREIVRQVVRSGVSIGANVAEGQGGATRKDFLHFLVIARKSAYETLYWLELLAHISKSVEEVQKLREECVTLTRVLSAIILKIQKTPNS